MERRGTPRAPRSSRTPASPSPRRRPRPGRVRRAARARRRPRPARRSCPAAGRRGRATPAPRPRRSRPPGARCCPTPLRAQSCGARPAASRGSPAARAAPSRRRPAATSPRGCRPSSAGAGRRSRARRRPARAAAQAAARPASPCRKKSTSISARAASCERTVKLRQCCSSGVPAGKRQPTRGSTSSRPGAGQPSVTISPGCSTPKCAERLRAQREAAHAGSDVRDPRDRGDAGVEREAAARHSTASASQVLTLRASGTTSGVPLSGSSMTRQGRPKTSSTSSAVTVSAGSPWATIAPSRMATRCVA